MYVGTPLSQSANFSAETWQARRQWHNILKAMKGKKFTAKNTLYGEASTQI